MTLSNIPTITTLICNKRWKKRRIALIGTNVCCCTNHILLSPLSAFAVIKKKNRHTHTHSAGFYRSRGCVTHDLHTYTARSRPANWLVSIARWRYIYRRRQFKCFAMQTCYYGKAKKKVQSNRLWDVFRTNCLKLKSE